MSEILFERLRDYYTKVAQVLKGEADAASVFPNSTDIGTSRENIYLEFIKNHVPSKCNAFLGGYVFDSFGKESKQLDIIVTSDTVIKFDLFNKEGNGKSFAPVEGTIGVVSIKSKLDKAQLFDSLSNLASIPPTQSLEGRVSITKKIEEYDNFPFKIIYASDGLSPETINLHLENFYNENKNIPENRMPDIIHVSGKYAFIKIRKEMKMLNHENHAEEDTGNSNYFLTDKDADISALMHTIIGLQDYAMASQYIINNYSWIAKNVLMAK
ncbi:DUF6602 domain-containing protein [Algoriphagus formosus]|uniref:DUF6602 domain-containing protein n=1 Tax=Algoriphagus formosus TaxID=2007308 RepID=A0A4R5UZP8_9BACT|nr:DUF6602 domain-containing protein [Algoriphagus aquimaris]TDK44751.1 hypothetical protein E1898_09240 [Algoriphagus aquimaris]